MSVILKFQKIMILCLRGQNDEKSTKCTCLWLNMWMMTSWLLELVCNLNSVIIKWEVLQVYLLCLVLILRMHLERLLCKQIVCHFKVSDFRRFFSLLCVRGW